MASWVIAIALLAAMIVSFFYGFWVFIPFLLVPFFLLFIRGATRRSMRRSVVREVEARRAMIRSDASDDFVGREPIDPVLRHEERHIGAGPAFSEPRDARAGRAPTRRGEAFGSDVDPSDRTLH